MKAKGIGFAPPELRKTIKEFDFQHIEPSSIPSFIYAANPIFCGMRIFELALDMEHAGLALENHHQSIFVVAHLYNAMLQTGLLKIRWPEMDHIIQLHIGTFFAGELPKTERDFSSRFALQLGFSLQRLRCNCRDRKKLTSSKPYRPGMQDGPQMQTTKMSQIIRQYFQKKLSMDQCLYQLEALIDSESQSQALVSRSRPTKPRVYQRQLTPLQLLSHIQTYLPPAIENMQIDYMSLVRTCNSLLRDIRATINESMGEDGDLVYGLKDDNGESDDKNLIMMGLGILKEAAEWGLVQDETLRGRMRGLILRGGPQLEVAGIVMAEFIRELLGIEESDDEEAEEEEAREEKMKKEVKMIDG
jgi:hypothetical protein